VYSPILPNFSSALSRPSLIKHSCGNALWVKPKDQKFWPEQKRIELGKPAREHVNNVDWSVRSCDTLTRSNTLLVHVLHVDFGYLALWQFT